MFPKNKNREFYKKSRRYAKPARRCAGTTVCTQKILSPASLFPGRLFMMYTNDYL